MTNYINTLIEQKSDHRSSVCIPDQVREFLINHLPREMMCSSTLKADGEVNIRTFTLKKHKALRFEHIQPNHANFKSFIIIDDDGLEPDNYLDLPVPKPNLVVINPKTGHSQKWYFLKTGVPTTYFGCKKAKDYFATTIFKLTAIYNGDNCYTGFLARNPLSNRHIVFSPRSEPYTLDEINNEIGVTAHDYEKGNKYKSDAFLLINEYCRRHKKVAEAAGYGRNCEIFEILRHQAYLEWHKYDCAEMFQKVLEVDAAKINRSRYPDNLLPDNELVSISKSIANYCFSRRIKKTASVKSFSDRQKKRGRIGGKARSDLYKDARAKFITEYTQNSHLSSKVLASLCGVSERTIRNYKKQMQFDLPLPVFQEEDIYLRSNKYLAKELGVSIRTIQRRRAKAKILSAQAINKALLKNVIDRGGDKMANGHFRYIPGVKVFALIVVPFSYIFSLIKSIVINPLPP
ncbi:replication initiation protein [Acinetobacter variabilis]|uniref:replication initiation protein n=1 Tax=Acinetobacter variabilis TaxID=70346 RepID=UPI002FDACE9D